MSPVQEKKLVKSLEARLDQVDKRITDLDFTLRTIKAWYEANKQNLCSHPSDTVEAEFNESEQYSYCLLCEKDLTEEYLSKMPEYLDDPERDERMAF